MTRNRQAVAAALLLVGTATACGAIEDLKPEQSTFAQGTAKEIFAAARKDVRSLKSVHVEGSIRDEGRPGSFDLSVSRSGECEGDLTVTGMHFDLLVADKRVFIRPDEAFFGRLGLSPDQAVQAVSHLGDRWFEDGSKQFGSLCTSVQELFNVSDQGFKSLRKALPGTVTASDGGMYAGASSVVLSATGPKGNFTMTVGVEEPHHVFALTALNTGKTDGGLTFSDHDVPVDTEVPDKGSILSMPSRQ